MSEPTKSEESSKKRNAGRRFWWGFLAAVLLAILLPLVILSTGLIHMGATTEPGTIERSLASLALNRSVANRAPDAANPLSGDAAALETGTTHFRDMCLLCHGAPGIEPYEFAEGLNPNPPELSTVLSDWTDGELFWLTKHGIRLTGMPAFGTTHTDEELWSIVAFVRHLPDLTASERRVLREASQQGRHHGDMRGQEGGAHDHHNHADEPHHKH